MLTPSSLEYVGKLSYGAHGDVFRARREDGAEVAVKIFNLSHETTSCKDREFEALRVLHEHPHENLLSVLGFGEKDTAHGRFFNGTRVPKGPWVLMERMDSDLMDALLRLGSGIPPPTLLAARILLGTAEALVHLHDLGYCHMDVKPENILVSNFGDETRVKVRLIDYGYVQSHRATFTRMIGTPAYNAPEQIRREPYDGRAVDAWQLGMCASVTLHNAYAFPKWGDEAILKCRPVVAIHIPPALGTVIQGLLNKDPAARMTVHEARDRIRTWIATAEDEIAG